MSNQAIKIQNVKGFRDFLPDDKRAKDYLIEKIAQIFQLYGFEPLETPTVEYASLLLKKYGQGAEKLVYTFQDRGGRNLALRYDQTVPTARILNQYKDILPKYFRRYQIQNVYRADKPQRGRYREFTQCDIDIFNSTSPIADAEIIAASYSALKYIGYPSILITINDRQTLFANLKPFTNKKIDIYSLVQSIDKLEKIGLKAVIAELEKKGLTEKQSLKALDVLKSTTLSANLKKIIDYSIRLGVNQKDLKFSPTLARGLDYYTGMIFEIALPGYSAGSVAGGGRYDNLIGQLGGIPTPAVGVAFGLDRMIEAACQFDLLPKQNGLTKVLISIFSEDTCPVALELAAELRKEKIKTEVFPQITRLEHQLKYADKKNISYVIIIGPEEAKKNSLKLKNMKTGDQKEIKIENIVKVLKSLRI